MKSLLKHLMLLLPVALFAASTSFANAEMVPQHNQAGNNWHPGLRTYDYGGYRGATHDTVVFSPPVYPSPRVVRLGGNGGYFNQIYFVSGPAYASPPTVYLGGNGGGYNQIFSRTGLLDVSTNYP